MCRRSLAFLSDQRALSRHRDLQITPALECLTLRTPLKSFCNIAYIDLLVALSTLPHPHACILNINIKAAQNSNEPERGR